MLSRPDLGVPPHLGYTASTLDRAADRRPRIHLLGSELLVLRKSAATIALAYPNPGGEDPAFTFAEATALAPWRERMFLGLQDGAPRFAVGIDKEAAEGLKTRGDLLVTDLRAIA